MLNLHLLAHITSCNILGNINLHSLLPEALLKVSIHLGLTNSVWSPMTFSISLHVIFEAHKGIL
jgi:hypothetical protein